MEPIRSVRHREVIQDPWGGTSRVVEQRDEAHALTDEGALQSCHDTQRVAAVCGCVRAIGGICASCGGSVCIACFAFCGRCHKPVCPRHSVRTSLPSGSVDVACTECASSRSRRQLAGRFWRVLLSPFVDFARSS